MRKLFLNKLSYNTSFYGESNIEIDDGYSFFLFRWRRTKDPVAGSFVQSMIVMAKDGTAVSFLFSFRGSRSNREPSRSSMKMLIQA